MANIQLKDLKTAEKQLNGQEYVYISQEDKTRKTTINDISEFTNNKITPHLHQLSGQNLLINGDFQVWQRGTSFTGMGVYCSDRWYKSHGTIKKTTNGLQLTSIQNDWNLLRQYVEDFRFLSNKTMTLSCKVKYVTNCTKLDLLWFNGTSWYGTNFKDKQINNTEILKFTFTPNLSSASKFAIGINLNNTDESIEIEWVKLELGAVATPLVPRQYGEELALCQRYYQSTTLTQNVIASDNGQLQLGMNGIPMRIRPTAKYITQAYAHSADTGTKVITLCSDINKPETTIEILWVENGTTFPVDIRGLTSSNVANGELWTINNNNSPSNRLSGFVKVSFDAEIY